MDRGIGRRTSRKLGYLKSVQPDAGGLGAGISTEKENDGKGTGVCP